VHSKGANSIATSGLCCRNELVDTEWSIYVLFGKNGVINK